MHGGHAFQSNWMAFGCKGMPEVGARQIDGYDNSLAVDPVQGGDASSVRTYDKIIPLTYWVPLD